MAHGSYGKRRVSGRLPLSGSYASSSRGLGVRHTKDNDKKAKIASIKNQIRSVERLLRKALPLEMKDAQQRRLEDLKRQIEFHANAELEQKLVLRYRKVRFLERRKIERAIRRLERLQRAVADNANDDMAKRAADRKLLQLKEDLEYVRFFPKTEKYVSLYSGGDDENITSQRNKLRNQIKANLIAAAASGLELEETGSEDDGAIYVSEDDFFLAGSSSDDADADDEWTDKSSRPGDDKDDTSKEVGTSSPKTVTHYGDRSRYKRLSNLGKAPLLVDASDGSQIHSLSARDLMPPPRNPNYLSSSTSGYSESRNQPSSCGSPIMIISGPSLTHSTGQGARGDCSLSSGGDMTMITTTAGSCNSDVQQQPRHKRSRCKKKKK